MELAGLLRNGDHAAFTEIYDRFFGVLYMHALHRLRDTDEAKDIVQELFTSLWLKHETLSCTNLSNYLYTAVRNRVLNNIAHHSVEARYMAALPSTVNTDSCLADHRLRERQLAAIIEEEINALPAKMREVFLLSRKEHLSYKEISDRLGITEQSVRSHVKNALRILKVRLGVVIYFLPLFLR